MCTHFYEDFGLEVRIARYHNVYGPKGTWDGGREKAPAALCRKVAVAKYSVEKKIEIWGDGEQTRSFTFIEDCIKGSILLMESNVRDPLNIGSSEMVSINSLVTIIEKISEVVLSRTYDLSAPKGVRGRNSDNSQVVKKLGWEPQINLHEGLTKTYEWIENQVKLKNKI